MIYTVTLNPSIDYYMELDDFYAGGLNRSRSESVRAGGKGINVSLMLKDMDIDSVAAGFIAGFTGEEIIRVLKEKGIRSEFVSIPGQNARINVKVNSKGGLETEINGKGLSVTNDDIGRLYEKLDMLVSGDILILSGSVCEGAGEDIYADMVTFAKSRGAVTVVDASGPLLKKAIDKGPFMVKPNLAELTELFADEERVLTADTVSSVEEYRKRRMITEDRIIEYAGRIKKKGVSLVIVSLGENGAILTDTDGNVYKQDIPAKHEYSKDTAAGSTAGADGDKGIVSTVGAGDSLLAGFTAEYFYGSKDPVKALKKGVYMGTVTALGGGLHR